MADITFFVGKKRNIAERLWVAEYVAVGEKARREEWTDSIAVGSVPFVEKVKALLGFGRKGEMS